MIIKLSVDRNTMNLLVVFIILSSSPLVWTLRSFRHWDYDLEPFVAQPHANENHGNIHRPGDVGKLVNHSTEADGTTVCVFKTEDASPQENRFVCVFGAECCDTDGCCFIPHPGATLKAVTLFLLSMLGCILLISLCLVLKSKTESEMDNQIPRQTDRLLSNRGVSFELSSIPRQTNIPQAPHH